MNDLTDPRKMRKAIEKIASDYYFDESSKAQFTSATVRSVLMAAKHAGWSGEDTMTALAYSAIQLAERYAQQSLQMLNTMPPRSLIPDDERARKEPKT